MMRIYPLRLSLLLLLALSTGATYGQEKKELTLEDAVLRQWSTFYPANTYGVQWIPGTDDYVFQKPEKDGLYLMKGSATSREQGEKLFSIEELNTAAGTSMQRMPAFDWIDEKEARFKSENTMYQVNVTTKAVKKLVSYDAMGEHAEFDPTSGAMAYTLGNNLLVATSAGKTIQITDEKNEDILSGQAVHRQEFGISKGIWWSAKGNKLAYYRMDESMVSDYPIIDVSETPARLTKIKYPMAGLKSHHVTVGVYDIATGKSVFMKTGLPEDQYLTCVTWGPEEKYVYIALVNRAQDHVWLNQYDAATGRLMRTLFEEEDEQYVEPEHQLVFLPNTPTEFLWYSERDGFQHLYHYDTGGKLIKQLTSGNWVVLDILGFSDDGNSLTVSGTGAVPTETHVYKVDLEKGGQKQLTKASGTHRAKVNSSGKFIVSNYSNTTTPRVIEILDHKSKKVKLLQASENPLKGYTVPTVEQSHLKAKDGTPLHYTMLTPSDFDETKKYPVLVYVYGGPRVQIVTNSWLGGARLWMHYLAEQGFIVFQMDSRGSSNRGLEYEQAIHRNCGDMEMSDQLDGVAYLKSLPYVDGDRMAVNGWSYGGFLTTSLMLRQPGTFKVGIAGGAVIDWKWYEIMYGEKYMDSPEENPEGYKKASLLNYVAALEGKLMMIHGTSDDVVVLQHNQAFMAQCIQEGVHVDLMLYPGHGHNVGGKDRLHLVQTIVDYILENL
jgi:dipeptidyl-peptidase-4